MSVFIRKGCWALIASVTFIATAVGADSTPVRFRISGIDTGGSNPRELPKDLDPKKRKAIEKAMRDAQRFAGKKQRVTCQQCQLLAMLAIGREIGEDNMRSQSGVAETAGLVATLPYHVSLEQNLTELARAVRSADYQHKIEPTLQFGLMVELEKRAAGRTLAAVKKVKGVASAGASYDPKEKTLWFGADPDKNLALADVVEAVKNAGVDVPLKRRANEPAKAE